MNLSNLVLFALATVGLTNILIYGKILDGLRRKIQSIVPAPIYEVLECYQCTGFWAGLVAGTLISTNPFVLVMCSFASSFLAEYAQVFRDYLEANSMVNLPPPQQNLPGEYRLDEDAIRADLPDHPTAVFNNNKLDIFYTNQYVQNEQVFPKESRDNMVVFPAFQNLPILPGTVTGTVFIDDAPVQRMIVSLDGGITLSKIGSIEVVKSGVMDHESGEITFFLDLTHKFETIHLVVCYEYNME